MYSYDTVSEAVSGLKKRGYTLDFNLEQDGISSRDLPAALSPSEFEITEIHRFEGNSDPDDEAVVYAIESRHGTKGILVNGFGISSDTIGEEMIRKLTIHHSPE
jgi:hypothetical protein